MQQSSSQQNMVPHSVVLHGGGPHVPFSQNGCGPGQVLPLLPQLKGSLVSSTHPSGQHRNSTLHVVQAAPELLLAVELAVELVLADTLEALPVVTLALSATLPPLPEAEPLMPVCRWGDEHAAASASAPDADARAAARLRAGTTVDRTP